MFVGPYLQEHERTSFGKHYNNMTEGFLALPLPLPGTAVWRGMQSRKAIIKLLARCAAASKKARPAPPARRGAPSPRPRLLFPPG